MELVDIKIKIAEALESVGIFIYLDDTTDIDLTNLIEDSIQFISIIIKLEELFGIEISNELLLIDNFKSLENICAIFQGLLASRRIISDT